jgi:hypothetical protein
MMGESRDARSSPIDVGLDQGSEATKDDTCKGLCLLERLVWPDSMTLHERRS